MGPVHAPDAAVMLDKLGGEIQHGSAMLTSACRAAIAEYVRSQAQPPDKFSHQPRLYQLAVELAEGGPFDDDVLYAAAWLHDLGVFIGHRPEELEALAKWDNVAYAMEKAPGLLESSGFPVEKIPAVVEVIRTHQPSQTPTSVEGVLLREADILEQLGAVGVLRFVCKVGRDTRYITFSDALRTLKRNLDNFPGKLTLESAKRRAAPRVALLESFISAAESEANGAGL